MRYVYQNIQSLQLEISSHCNVACPQCPRNHYGGPTVADLPLINWSLQDLKNILDIDFINQLEFIYFCGTYGDPMFNKNIVDMCSWLKTANPKLQIGIHTNGSLGRPGQYQELAQLADFMAFGIDGLEDTNHLYRRNASWNRLMNNVQTFIDSGGCAHWDFIVFEHNQHQVEGARLLSQQLGFNTFNVKKTSRFFNKQHKLVPFVQVLDDDLRPVYQIKPSTDPAYLNQQYDILDRIDTDSYTTTAKINCYYLHKNEIYIGADGFVFPCGWLHDRLYGVESENSVDRKILFDMMEQGGGKHIANCFSTPLKQIVDGPWFTSIHNSWGSNQLERCAWLCGDRVNLIQEQNQMVNYDL